MANMKFTDLYFVAYNQDKPQCHGKILMQVEPGYYLIETEGLALPDAFGKLFHISDMKEWVFFEKQEDLGTYIKQYVIPVLEDNYQLSKTGVNT